MYGKSKPGWMKNLTIMGSHSSAHGVATKSKEHDRKYYAADRGFMMQENPNAADSSDRRHVSEDAEPMQ
jgi:hypothetical protein